MGDGTTPVTGGCMCGAVRYKARGAPVWVGHCHCESCRRATGAPVVTFVCFKVDQVAFTKGERRIYNSSPGVGRAFCGQCGTPLTWEGKSNMPARGAILEVYISTLDDPNAFTPTNHICYSEKIAWFDVADNLPRHHGMEFNSEVDRRGPVKDGLPG
jgi:hypothetical protein